MVLKKIFFSFSVLTVSFGLGLDLDSNLFGLGLDLDSNLFGLGLDSDSNLFGVGLVMDSTKVDLTTALDKPTHNFVPGQQVLIRSLKPVAVGKPRYLGPAVVIAVTRTGVLTDHQPQ